MKITCKFLTKIKEISAAKYTMVALPNHFIYSVMQANMEKKQHLSILPSEGMLYYIRILLIYWNE